MHRIRSGVRPRSLHGAITLEPASARHCQSDASHTRLALLSSRGTHRLSIALISMFRLRRSVERTPLSRSCWRCRRQPSRTLILADIHQRPGSGTLKASLNSPADDASRAISSTTRSRTYESSIRWAVASPPAVHPAAAPAVAITVRAEPCPMPPAVDGTVASASATVFLPAARSPVEIWARAISASADARIPSSGIFRAAERAIDREFNAAGALPVPCRSLAMRASTAAH